LGDVNVLNFILDEMGWMLFELYLENGTHLHIGSSPDSRDFFTQVYQEPCTGLTEPAR